MEYHPDKVLITCLLTDVVKITHECLEESQASARMSCR